MMENLFLFGGLLATASALWTAHRIRARYRREVQTNRSRLTAGSVLQETASGPIEYASVGEGLPVLIAHGGAGGFDQGLLIARGYVGDGLRAIAPSRFGYLRTPLASDSSAAAQADAYAQLLDALNIDRVAILGVSAGGPSSLQFALRHPARCAALVMVAAVSQHLPARSTGIYRSDLLYWFATTYLRSRALAAVGVTADLQAGLSQAERRYLADMFRSMSPFSARLAGQLHDIEEWADAERWARDYPLETIDTPTLVIHAVDDTVVPFTHGEHTARSIPGARLIQLPSGGHMRLGHMASSKAEITNFVLRHMGGDE